MLRHSPSFFFSRDQPTCPEMWTAGYIIILPVPLMQNLDRIWFLLFLAWSRGELNKTVWQQIINDVLGLFFFFFSFFNSRVTGLENLPPKILLLHHPQGNMTAAVPKHSPQFWLVWSHTILSEIIWASEEMHNCVFDAPDRLGLLKV